jgi:hypothetical protein
VSARDEAIESEYRLGKSSAEIGRAYGLTDRRVLQILDYRGVERRKPKPTPNAYRCRWLGFTKKSA